MKGFGYWRDPLFLASTALYGLNRWVVLPRVHSRFLHGQFDDCLLIPSALPLLLWAQRKLHLRTHDQYPTAMEILLHLVVWSVLFEWIGPHLMRVTGDVRDVLAYVAGALVAWGWWRWREHSLLRPA